MLSLPEAEREVLWGRLIERIEQYLQSVEQLPVAPRLDPDAIRAFVRNASWDEPMQASRAVDFAAEGLTRYQVHTPHPRYWGLFNPAPTTMGIAADALVAAFNPQIAAWSHNPFAAEVEAEIVRRFGRLFGYPEGSIDGTMASGGMEANHTALLAALTWKFPSFLKTGLRALTQSPVFYASAECHHSFPKAARLCGLGMESLRLVPVDSRLQMIPEELERLIRKDLEAGLAPFAVMATAGTTNAGAIDPLPALAGIARAHELWLHVDAAWGGGAAFVPELRPLLAGIEQSDSITMDAHKWLSVPMGAGVYLTRHREILDATFRVQTAYMPKDAAGFDIVDPHLHSMQWSRRFIGLKIFLSLTVAGWKGYEEAIRHQTAMGALLRSKLASDGWTMMNDTPLPVVCFTMPGFEAPQLQAIVTDVLRSGEAWISTTVIAGKTTVLRACVTHYGSQPSHVEDLVQTLHRARASQAAVLSQSASARD
jgi:glutamate/tyrosine decarboxylase-like PLP-dependent enzyme